MTGLAHHHNPDNTSPPLRIPLAAAILQDGSSFGSVTCGDLRIAPLSKSSVGCFIEAVACEIGRRYPETGEPYAHELLTLSGVYGTNPATRKVILGGYMSRELVGFTVATPKRGHRVKFGPTVVFPRLRGLGVASILRTAGERHFARMGFEYAYSTCREDNYAARSYVVKSNYHLVGRLEGQYSPGITELVYAKQLLGRPETYSPLIIHTAQVSKSLPFLLMRKRGGAAKIELPKTIFHSPKQFAELLELSIQSAQREGIRRVYIKIPATPTLAQLAKRLDLRAESYGLPDFSSRPRVVMAKSFEE